MKNYNSFTMKSEASILADNCLWMAIILPAFISIINVESSKLLDCAQNMFSIMRGIFLLQHTAIIAIDIVKRDFDGLPTFFLWIARRKAQVLLWQNKSQGSPSQLSVWIFALYYRGSWKFHVYLFINCGQTATLNTNFLCKSSV